MIARLTGALVDRGTDWLVLDIHGVGFRVSVSRRTAERLPVEGVPLSLEIHTHVRDDAIVLYGFLDALEREAFEALISVSGLGPKAALAVLSGIDAVELARAVASEDLARLCLIPGVGKKKAERLVLELKERLLPLAQADEGSPPSSTLDDLRSALINLGYKPAEAQASVDQLRRQALAGQDLDSLLPQALRLLKG